MLWPMQCIKETSFHTCEHSGQRHLPAPVVSLASNEATLVLQSSEYAQRIQWQTRISADRYALPLAVVRIELSLWTSGWPAAARRGSQSLQNPMANREQHWYPPGFGADFWRIRGGYRGLQRPWHTIIGFTNLFHFLWGHYLELLHSSVHSFFQPLPFLWMHNYRNKM